MANTVELKIKISDDGGFKKVQVDAEDLKGAIAAVHEEAERLSGSVVNWAQTAQAAQGLNDVVKKLQGGIKSLTEGYTTQVEAETRLEATMSNSMNATREEVDAILDLCDAQERLGVVDSKAAAAGAQELATYLERSDSLKALIPVLNDMNAQQYGFNATCESSVTIATMLGKVMQGQVGALSRYGYSFDEAQEKVLKFGTEEERVAVLAEVVSASVGGVNEALGRTDVGKQIIMANQFDKIKDKLGEIVYGIMPIIDGGAAFVTFTTGAVQAAASVKSLVASMTLLSKSIVVNTANWVKNTSVMIANKAVTLAKAVADKTAAAAAAAWNAIQKVLNLTLTANPIGLIVTAIGALVTAIVGAYKNSEKFRNIVDGLWASIKPLVSILIDGLVKALQKVAEWTKKAFDWLKGLLGLSGESVDIEVNTKTPETSITTLTSSFASKDELTLVNIRDKIKGLREELDNATKDTAAGINKQIEYWEELEAEIVNAGRKAGETPVSSPADSSDPTGLIATLEKQIEDARTRLAAATSEAAIESINRELEGYENELDRYRELGKTIGSAVSDGLEDEELTLIVDASKLKDINNNIAYYRQELQKSTAEGAADINKQIEYWQGLADAITSAGKSSKTAVAEINKIADARDGLSGVSSIIQSMSSVMNESAAAWLEWGANVIQAIAQAVQPIADYIAALAAKTLAEKSDMTSTAANSAVQVSSAMSNTTAARSEATANAAAAATGAGKSVASIPYVGAILAVAAIASVIAAMANIPKFAKGGIAYGPTLGLFGEYAGASSNPEVVAPLDRLRSLIGNTGGDGMSGEVVFRVKGRDLEGVLVKRSNIVRRS